MPPPLRHLAQVDVDDAIELRDTIIRSGRDFHKPSKQVKDAGVGSRPPAVGLFSKDRDVDRSLVSILLSPQDAAVMCGEDTVFREEDEEEGCGPPEPSSPEGAIFPLPATLQQPHADDDDDDAASALIRSPGDEVLALLARMDSWHYDSFELDRACQGKSLSVLTFAILTKYELVCSRDLVDESKLARFLQRIERGYPDNPYHCRFARPALLVLAFRSCNWTSLCAHPCCQCTGSTRQMWCGLCSAC